MKTACPSARSWNPSGLIARELVDSWSGELVRRRGHSQMVGEPSDSELWLRIGSGDEAAFAALYERHADAIYNFCFRRIASWARAEDLVAEVFLVVWRR